MDGKPQIKAIICTFQKNSLSGISEMDGNHKKLIPFLGNGPHSTPQPYPPANRIASLSGMRPIQGDAEDRAAILQPAIDEVLNLMPFVPYLCLGFSVVTLWSSVFLL